MQSRNVLKEGPLFNRESLAAYLQSQSFEKRAATVLSLLYDNPAGLTQDEAAARLGMLSQTCAPIFTQLLQRGLILRKRRPGNPEEYERRLTRNGYRAAVCVIALDLPAAVLKDREQKRMKRIEKISEKTALAENAVLREILADLVGIIEEQIPFKEADLSDALQIIREEYL
jgi:DNA-binding MarR family transcriptional regulator